MAINKLGVIGAGNMAMAIVNGILRVKAMEPSQIGMFVHTPEKLPKFQEKGFVICENAANVYSSSEMVLLGVKPQVMPSVLSELAVLPYEGQIIISIAAGISISYLQDRLGATAKIVRVMPNTPLMIGQGACAFSCSPNVSATEYSRVIDLFSAMSVTVQIDENAMNEIIPVHGSSPAFVYYIINCMVQSAVKNGIDEATALQLICATFIGATNMITSTHTPIQQLIKNVCSPGGTTLEALKVFDEHDLPAVFDEAFEKCISRAYELGL